MEKVEEKIDETYITINKRLHHTHLLMHFYLTQAYGKCSKECFYGRDSKDKIVDCVKRCEAPRIEAANLMQPEIAKFQKNMRQSVLACKEGFERNTKAAGVHDKFEACMNRIINDSVKVVIPEMGERLKKALSID